jgi:polyferredoxin
MARLGAGAIFGAESVLAKEGAAVDAVAVSDVRLLRYPAKALPRALQESSSLRCKMLGGIARSLHDATSDVLDLLKGTDVIARLVQGDTDPDEMIAVSARMRGIKRKMERCAGETSPVLVTGEDGTGKTLVSRLIHDGSDRSAGPVIAVNCRELAPGNAAELILGEDLGGCVPDAGHGSGGIHLAHNGTLVLRSADTLEPGAQRLLAGYLNAARSRGPNVYPNTRVVVTARSISATENDSGACLIPALLESFEETIELPPLAERPKDILPLAEEFLKKHGDEAPVITEEARHALLSQPYQRRNVAELREVVDLAVRVADGPEIRAEHIFGGVGEGVIPLGVDITGSPMIRRLLRPGWMPFLRYATFVGFGAVIVACLTATSTAIGRTANSAIWAVWEPVVFGLFLVAGPVWCTVCPLSTAGRLAKRLGGAERPPPSWILRHGPWLAIVGFALIVWSERFFDSAANPLASGILLVCLIAAAAICGWLYKREVWCRHLCPLGRLGTALAPASPFQLTANSRVCASSCTTHECYRGVDEIPGCTVFHHPLDGMEAHRCKLCLDCLRSCPHGSARLQIRPPLAAIWRLDAGSADLAMFATAVSLLALVLAAGLAFPVVAEPLNFTALCALAVAVGIFVYKGITRLVGSDQGPVNVTRTAMAMMILGWSALMTSQLANIPAIADTNLVLTDASWLPSWAPVELSLLTVLQIGVVLAGVFLALVTLDQVRFRRGPDAKTWIWWLVPFVFGGYAATVIYLVIT